MASLCGTKNISLAQADPEIAGVIEQELKRQVCGLELIASENFTSQPVIEALGTILTNKYSEGQIGKRYYGGTEFIDHIEGACKDRVLKAFNLNPQEWHANVQPYSGSTANWAVYVGLLQPHDRVMGLDLPSGGHLTHGYYTAKKRVSTTSIFFESLPYQVKPDGYLDYDALEAQAELFRPKMIITGASAYPREWDWARCRAIADKVGAILMADIAHISGLVAAGVHSSPFPYCDVVTSTTHKTLRGPRSGLILIRKCTRGADPKPLDWPDKLDFAVFPSIQGGPHNHQIAAVATQMLEVATPGFRQYAQQVIANAQALCAALQKRGYKIQTGGTDNHIVLWDCRPCGLTGSKVERVLEMAAISCNKNTVVGDTSALVPGGIRLGTSALTTRGFVEKDMEVTAAFIERAVELCKAAQAKAGAKLVDVVKALEADPAVKTLRTEVEKYAVAFPFPACTDEKRAALAATL